MAIGVHKITADFEDALCEYTGAPYAIALDNGSSALFLALIWYKKTMVHSGSISIPSRTYMSVPCSVIHAGFKPHFEPVEGKTISGAYQLKPTPVYDSALRFTAGMYIPGQFQCLSFTGPFKHLKLGKGGAILTDNEEAYKWFKKARFSGRGECSYHEDNFDDKPVIGWNMYMPVETAARGLHMMPQFYDKDGKPKSNEDLTLPYPDLSKFKLWQ